MKNTFGQSIGLTVFGESHGSCVGVVIDGLPAGIEINNEYISKVLEKRKPKSQIETARVESDNFEILSGVFNGKSTRAKAVCNARTIAADLPPVGWHKTATLLKCASNRRLEAFELKKGTVFTLTIEPVNAVIETAYLTQCPWEVMKNRNFPEKSGK